MSGPSERAAARRAARRDDPARARGTSGKARGAAARASDAVRQRPTLTGRAVILASVLALVVFTLAVPAREVISQRAQINALRAANDATQSRVDDLQVRQDRLSDPAYLTSLIRERLHYVLPGEVGYVVLDPSEAPAPTKAVTSVAAVAWYSTVWSSVTATDDTGSTADAPKIVVRPSAPR